MPDTNESRPDWALLTRVVAGKADEHDVIQLERWIGSDTARRRYVEGVRALWQQGGTPVEGVDVDDALARIKGLRPPHRRVLRFPGTAAIERSTRWRHGIWSFGGMATAAGVAAVAMLWLNARQHATSDVPPGQVSEVSTRRAERAEVRLPDGSRLVLGPASKVRYTSDYGVRRRDVLLEGQALFVVTHDQRRPFVVRTARSVTTDLGTTFMVRDYREDRVADVMVAEGKAAVSRPVEEKAQGKPAPPAAMLEAGDIATMASDGRVQVRRDVGPQPYVGWSDGRLVFEDTPLAEVLAQISRWYDVDARAADSIAARRRLTASYSYSTEPLVDILPLIAASLDLRVERRDRIVRFHAQATVPVRGAS